MIGDPQGQLMSIDSAIDNAKVVSKIWLALIQKIWFRCCKKYVWMQAAFYWASKRHFWELGLDKRRWDFLSELEIW